MLITHALGRSLPGRWRLPLATLVVAFCTTLALAIGGAAQAQAAPFYKIISLRDSGRCLEVPGASTLDVGIITGNCVAGAQNQHWTLEYSDTDWRGRPFYRIVARHSGKCVDVAGGSTDPWGRIIQYYCWNGNNQQWHFTNRSGNGSIVSRHSELCLFATSPENGPVYQDYCRGAANQQWKLVPTS